MMTRSLGRAFHIGLLVLSCSAFLRASPPQVQVSKDGARWVIEAVGTETVQPDVIHLMMKMEYESSLAADATSRGEKQLQEFLTAVEGLKIPNLTYRIANNLITPASARRGQVSGFVYARNIIFTLTQAQTGQPASALDRVVAQLEDLGARYNSHCVTCIGSG